LDNNNQISVICALDLDRTPIIKHFIDWLELNTHNRVVVDKCSKLFYRSKIQVYVGNRALLQLFFASYFSNKTLVYWSLESYTGFENNSKIMWLTRIQYLINWRFIKVVYPLEIRKLSMPIPILKSNMFIIPNVPVLPFDLLNHFRDSQRVIDFIHYGELDNRRVYTNDILSFVKVIEGLIEVYGVNYFPLIENEKFVYYGGVISHLDLMKKLKSCRFGFVGYRPIDFNTRTAAPNKLFEMMVNGVIPLISSENRHLKEFVVSDLQIFNWTDPLPILVEQFNRLLCVEEQIRKEGVNLVLNKYNTDIYFPKFWNEIKICSI